jgi:hypothetical protein
MGYNTSMIVLNDALHAIKEDHEFGAKVYDAVGQLNVYNRATAAGRPRLSSHLGGVDISSGCNVNAATVIETHHADNTTLLAVGGNCASILHETFGYCHNESGMQVRLLQEWAEKLGYRVVKKRKGA